MKKPEGYIYEVAQQNVALQKPLKLSYTVLMKPHQILSFMLLLSFKAFSMTQILPKTLEARSIISQEKVSQPIQLSDKRGLVVVFLSAKCPCSNSHIEILKNLAVKYKEFKFIGIHSNTDEDLKTSKDYFTQAQLPFEVLEDKNAILADQFKAYKTPHAFLINNKSELVYQGGVTDSALAEHSKKNYLTLALEDLTENRSVKITEGRTLGCVILRTEKTTVDQHVF